MAKETTKRKKMTDEELLEKFKEFFQEYEALVRTYKRIGSRALALTLVDDESLVWLYIDDHNWQFGTKLWRKPPENVNRTFKERDRRESTSCFR